MKEIWKDIIGYEGFYSISNTGLVKRVTTNKIKYPSLNSWGYEVVSLSKPNTKLMWASQGNRAEPTSDKQLEGWVQEIPPHEMENWVQYKQDLAIKYLYQEGIPEWDSSFEFNTTSYVKYNGVIYKLKDAAEVPNVNKQPDIETTSWEIAFEPYGASSPLAEEIRKIKELEGYLSLYVSKANPVMTGIATAPELKYFRQ